VFTGLDADPWSEKGESAIITQMEGKLNAKQNQKTNGLTKNEQESSLSGKKKN
jgi:hypothetical protein